VKDLSTDCVLYDQDDIVCDNVVVVPKNTVLSVALQKIVAWVCTRLSEIENFFVIKNVGNGAGVYKGTSLIGEKELKSLTSTNSSVTITPGTNTIDFSVNIPETCVTSTDNTIQVAEYGDNCLDLSVCIGSEDNTVIVTPDNGCFDLSVPKVCIVSTKGTINVNTSPEGCFDLDVNFNENNPCFFSGNNSVTVLYDADDNCFNLQTCVTSPSGSSISVELDEGCFTVDLDNLQKVIDTFPYNVASADDKQTIFVNNGVNDVIINIPDGLISNFTCVFIQKGVGEVTIQQSGTATLLKPADLQNKIKAQNNWAMVEKELNTNTYYLIGRLKPL
jgi:hypothetical protein